jgi:3-oxoadipate enol-lactonase
VSSDSGRPLVLLHGLGGDSGFWEDELSSWASTFQLIAIDLRGSGGTPPSPGGHTMSDLAADVVSVLDDAGLSSASVLGFSMGGNVAQTLAIEYPSRVDKLILASTFARMNVQARLFLDAVATGYAKDEDPAQMFALICPWLFSLEFLDDPSNESYVTYPDDEAAEEDPRAWQALYRAQRAFDARHTLAAITAPTLVLRGSEDRLVSASDSAYLAATIPNADLITLEGAGHLVNIELPEAFREHVVRFVTGANSVT